MKIRHQITWIMALVMLVPIYSVNYLYLQDSIRQQHAETDSALLTINQQMQHDINSYLQTALDTVRSDSLAPSLRDYLLADFRTRRENQSIIQERLISLVMKDSVNITSAALLDAEGTVLVDSAPEQAGRQEKNAPYFQQAASRNLPTLTGPVKLPWDTAPALYLASPIRDSADHFIGVLRIRVEQARLQQLISYLTLDEPLHAYAILSDDQGRILAHSEHPQLIGTIVSQKKQLEAVRGQDVETRLGWLNHATTATAPKAPSVTPPKPDRLVTDIIRDVPWHIMTIQPANHYYANEKRQWTGWLLEQAGITLLILLASYVAGRRIATPISRLNEEVVQSMRTGEPLHELPPSRNEVHQLSSSYASLTRELDRSLRTLAESEQHFRSLVTQVPGMVFRARADNKGTLLYMSPAAEPLLGYSPEQMCGDEGIGAMATVFSADLPAVREKIRQSLEQRSDIDLECRLRHASGRILWAHFRAAVIEQPGQAPLIEGLVLDITERKTIEQARQNIEQRYRNLVDSAPEAIVVMDLEHGGFIDSNPRAQKMFGFNTEEMRKLTGPGDISPERQPDGQLSAESCLFYLGEAVAGKNPSFEWLHKHRDGRVFPCEIHLSRLPDPDQILIRGSIFDISARKASEKALSESEEKLKLIFENTSDLVALYRVSENTEFFLESVNTAWLNTAKSRGIFVNPEDITGLPLEQLMTDTLRMPPEEVVLVASRFTQCVTSRSHLDFEDCLTIGASPFWIESQFVPVIDTENRCHWVLYTARDISARRAAENEVRKLNEELEMRVATRTAELNTANEDLRRATEHLVQSEKLASLGSVVAGVAHELNTPIGNTLTVATALQVQTRLFRAQLSEGSIKRSELAHYLDNCEESATLLERNSRRASELIGNFKQVAVDQTSARRRQFNLRQTMEEVLSTLQPQFKHVAHSIELNIPADVMMDSYPGPLEQVLTNLINNSLVHGFESRTDGLITITVAQKGEQINMVYADNGCGVPEELHRRIFDPFFTTKMGKGGSGLGLYLVYNLVTGMLGGSIRIHSRKGQGTRFEMNLPRIAPLRTEG